MRILILTAVLLVPLRAFAAETFTPRSMGTRFSLQVDVWPLEGLDVSTMSLNGQLALLPSLMVDIEVPWAAGSGDHGGVSPTALFGDMTIGAHGAFSAWSDAYAHVGASLSIPTRFGQSDQNTTAIQETAWISRAFVDLQRFAPSAVTVRIPAGFEARLFPHVFLRSELNAVVVIPLQPSVELSSTTAVLEQVDVLEGRGASGFRGGLEFQAAALVKDGLRGVEVLNAIQTAIEPFVGYEAPDHGFVARLGLLVDVNLPVGFEGGVSAVQCELGYKF